MGDDFLTRPRLSRIFYDGKYFSYPLTSKDVIGRLGLVESARCALSYVWAQRKRGRPAETFEDWVTARFGRRLYDAFFRSYTEKVWGIPGTEIRSQWAAQRIKDFSMWRAFLSIVGLNRKTTTTLIEEFRYPRLGPGQMWQRMAGHLEEDLDIPVRMRQRCVGGQARRRPHRDRHDPHERPRDRVRRGRRALDARPPGPDPRARPRASRSRARGRREAALPRLLPRRPDDRRGGALPGQLDLHPRPRRPRRPGAELRRLEPRDGRPGPHVPRRRVLLLRGRRPLGDVRRGGRQARDRRDGTDRPDRPVAGDRRRQGACAEGLSDVRRELRELGRRRSRGTWPGSRTSSPPDATACTATTTRITRCGRRSWPR